MKSGLEGRNNQHDFDEVVFNDRAVSMKSGLEGRNNLISGSRQWSEESMSQ